MIDLATITATLARDRVAEQFPGPALTDVTDATAAAAAAPAAPVRRAAIRCLRAVAERLEPAIA